MDQDDGRTPRGKIVAFPVAPQPTTPPSAVDSAIGAAIRRRRLAQHLTQGALAQSVGVTVHEIRAYEMGKIKLTSSEVIGLARGLGFSVKTLLELASQIDDDPKL